MACFLSTSSFLFASPALAGEVAAQQTEGVFGAIFMRETTKKTKQDPLRLTSLGTSPTGVGEANNLENMSHQTRPKPISSVGRVGRVCSLPFVAVIWVYRFTLSPIMGGHCRYVPTCSQYGLDAYRLHGPVRGTIMTIKRIGRCHPFAKGGYDPVEIPDSTHQAKDDLP